MKFDLKKIVPLVVSLLMFFLLCQFRSVPVSQFWKGYRMLYVYTEELAESDILAILEKNGCSSIVSLGRQRIPLISSIAPVQAQEEKSYIYRRSDFFMDKTHRAKVFYIPENQQSSLEKAIRELSAFQSTSAGTDGKSSFPWLAPCVCLLFMILGLIFSKDRFLYLSGTIFFIILTFSRPLFTVSAASVFFLFAFFIFHRIWGRKGFIKISLNSPYVVFIAAAPLLILFVSSPLNSLFYLFAISGSASLVCLYTLYAQKKEESYSFRPLYIRSARMIPLMGRLGIRLMGAMVFLLFFLLIGFKLLGNVSSISSASSMPALPAPVNQRESDLVQFSDFISWTWNTITFPYKKITEIQNTTPADGESVYITDYREENGRIIPESKVAFIFNSDFRDSVYKETEKLDYPALEKMMLKQGKNTRYSYSKKASSSSGERFGFILLLVFITVPAALATHYILGRKRYGLSI